MLRPTRLIPFLLLAVCTAAAQPSRPSPRPNILLILSDDAGYADFGFQGSREMRTPRLDRLAASGIRFTRGYVSACVCSPSRAGLVTGRYQQRFGYYHNLPYAMNHPHGLSVAEKTIADRLKALGYRTAVFGKWHLGERPQFHPNSRGFDEFLGCLKGSRSYRPYKPGAKGATPDRWLMRNRKQAKEHGYLTDRLADEAVGFIERNSKKPWFLYLSFTAVHTPMHARQEDLSGFTAIKKPRRKKLAAMTLALDRAVGRVLDTLAKHDLDRRTLVWFLNDNGGATNNACRNDPLRGFKGNHLEGGLRVPFLVRWTGTLPAGRVVEEPVISLDILPTSLAAAGGPLAKDQRFDGINLLPHLRSQTDGPPGRDLFWSANGIETIRRGCWKLIRTELADGPREYLFDLDKDPRELKNLVRENPKKARELARALAAWSKQNEPPRFRSWRRVDDKGRRKRLRTMGLEE